jgi:hypothetical protein
MRIAVVSRSIETGSGSAATWRTLLERMLGSLRRSAFPSHVAEVNVSPTRGAVTA